MGIAKGKQREHSCVAFQRTPAVVICKLEQQSLSAGHSVRDLLFLQMALKFEHRTSKGCNYGPPYEWSVYGCDPNVRLSLLGFQS